MVDIDENTSSSMEELYTFCIYIPNFVFHYLTSIIQIKDSNENMISLGKAELFKINEHFQQRGDNGFCQIVYVHV